MISQYLWNRCTKQYLPAVISQSTSEKSDFMPPAFDISKTIKPHVGLCLPNNNSLEKCPFMIIVVQI